jgi:hypothetical protein
MCVYACCPWPHGLISCTVNLIGCMCTVSSSYYFLIQLKWVTALGVCVCVCVCVCVRKIILILYTQTSSSSCLSHTRQLLIHVILGDGLCYPGYHFWQYYTGHFIMCSRITKIYYRKTIGHVFTKPVEIEGTTQKFFSQ